MAISLLAVHLFSGVLEHRFAVGVKHRRVIGDTDQACTFGNGQHLQFLTKVGFCSTLDTAAALTQIDRVQILFNNILLIVILLYQCGAEELQHLTLDGNAVLACLILDQLLGNTGTAHSLITKEHIGKRLDGSKPVNTLVLIKTLIFNGNGSIDQCLRNLLILSLLPIGAGIQLLKDFDLPLFIDMINVRG